MDIKPLGSVPSRRMPPESFTGTVWQNPIIEAPAPARIRCAWVRFEPRARTDVVFLSRLKAIILDLPQVELELESRHHDRVGEQTPTHSNQYHSDQT